MLVDEAGALACPIVRVLQTALPFQHGPAVIAVACQAIENAAKIDLAVTDAPKTPGTIEPILIAAIGPAHGAGGEFGVLDVKRTNPLMVAIDEAEVVQMLEQKVAGIVVDLHPWVVVDAAEETLERRAIVQILPGVKFEAEVDIGTIGLLEQRAPTPREFVEGAFDQPLGSRRIGIKERPGQPARKRYDLVRAKDRRARDRAPKILLSLGLPRRGPAPHLRRSQYVHRFIIGRMHGKQLAGTLSRNFTDRESGFRNHGFDSDDGILLR